MKHYLIIEPRGIVTSEFSLKYNDSVTRPVVLVQSDGLSQLFSRELSTVCLQSCVTTSPSPALRRSTAHFFNRKYGSNGIGRSLDQDR